LDLRGDFAAGAAGEIEGKGREGRRKEKREKYRRDWRKKNSLPRNKFW